MKTKDIRNLKSDELEAKLKEFSEELIKLRFQSATSQLKNPLQKRVLRRSIAKIKTIMHEEATRGEK